MVNLRYADMKDARLIFEWRNIPFIVERSTSQKTVTWKEHLNWFRNSLKSKDRILLIIENEKGAIGQVRLDRLNYGDCVIGAYILEEFTGRGLGVQAITRGVELTKKLWEVNEIYAFVRENNIAGHKGFKKAGFIEKKSKHKPEGHISLAITPK